MMLLHRPPWANQQLVAPDRRPTLARMEPSHSMAVVRVLGRSVCAFVLH